MATTWTVVRTTSIPASRDRIRDLLVDFRQWQQWSPWEDVDPELERVHSGAQRGVGAHYAWSGNRKAGAGTMEITDVADDHVDIALAFTRPFKSTNTTTFTLVERGGSTDVEWRMTGPMTFMTRVMGVFTSMDKFLGPDFEKGLAQLRTAATA